MLFAGQKAGFKTQMSLIFKESMFSILEIVQCLLLTSISIVSFKTEVSVIITDFQRVDVVHLGNCTISIINPLCGQDSQQLNRRQSYQFVLVVHFTFS